MKVDKVSVKKPTIKVKTKPAGKEQGTTRRECSAPEGQTEK